jgi:hypothetical protein
MLPCWRLFFSNSGKICYKPPGPPAPLRRTPKNAFPSSRWPPLQNGKENIHLDDSLFSVDFESVFVRVQVSQQGACVLRCLWCFADLRKNTPLILWSMCPMCFTRFCLLIYIYLISCCLFGVSQQGVCVCVCVCVLRCLRRFSDLRKITPMILWDMYLV